MKFSESHIGDAALERLNPHLPAETLEEVLCKVQQTETPCFPKHMSGEIRLAETGKTMEAVA